MIVQSRKKYKVVTEKNVPMKTRNGISLYADVIHPDEPGRKFQAWIITEYFASSNCQAIHSA
jgi:predicted acyl esterase